MLAKCARCQHVFSTPSYGLNKCPACGAELMLSPPAGSPESRNPPSAEPPANQNPSASSAAGEGPTGGIPGAEGAQAAPPEGGAASGPSAQGSEAHGAGGFGPMGALPPAPAPAVAGTSTPWEERATRGFVPALVETVRQSLLDPVHFFERMRVDNIDGTISYYWIVNAFAGLVGAVWEAVFNAVGMGSTQSVSLLEDNPFGQLFGGQPSPLMMLGVSFLGILLAPLWLFVVAGVLHLFAMLFKCANNGFNATLRTVAYSAGPLVLAVVPVCGSMVAAIWITVLWVIGLWKTQRGTVGGAVGAVLTPGALVFCCSCAVIAAIATMAGAAAAAAMGAQ